MDIINSQTFNENEYQKIINICNKKMQEKTDKYYIEQIYKLINSQDNLKLINSQDYLKLINSFKNLSFYEKVFDSVHSYNIKFKYEYFNITLSYKVSYCSEFGGISMDNTINIIDTHQETCYNLFGTTMISRFINILNLDINEDDIKKILTLIFKAYKPKENININ